MGTKGIVAEYIDRLLLLAQSCSGECTFAQRPADKTAHSAVLVDMVERIGHDPRIYQWSFRHVAQCHDHIRSTIAEVSFYFSIPVVPNSRMRKLLKYVIPFFLPGQPDAHPPILCNLKAILPLYQLKGWILGCILVGMLVYSFNGRAEYISVGFSVVKCIRCQKFSRLENDIAVFL